MEIAPTWPLPSHQPPAALPPANQKTGLTHEEAQRRFQQDGPNELPSHGKRGLGIIAWEVMMEPMFLLRPFVGRCRKLSTGDAAGNNGSGCALGRR